MKNKSSHFRGVTKTLRKSLVAILLLVLAVPFFSVETDHSKWLPSVECFDVYNIYIELNGGFAPLLVFSGDEKIADSGFCVGAGAGLDLNGWLFGLDYTLIRYSGNSDTFMECFTHNIVTLDVSKIFVKSQWRFLPEWLDLRFKVAIGWDFAMADYSTLSGESFSKNDSGFLYSAGIFAEFGTVPYVTPFIGMDFDFTHDKGGVYFMPVIALGVCTKIGAFRRKRPLDFNQGYTRKYTF